MCEAAPDAPALLRGRRVAIVGAGPAGLTLARLLTTHGVDVTIFERDASRSARPQGGSLDLHADAGALALERAGLGDGFRAVYRPEGQSSRVFDRRGVLRAELRPARGDASRPEIDRGTLRDLLLDALPPGTVRWGARLVALDRARDGAWRLAFADGSAAEADLVAGCDGIWSRVRPLRSGRAPRYAGVTFVQGLLADADRRHPGAAALVGPGNVMALGEDKALMAQRNGDGTIRVYAALRVPEGWTADRGLDGTGPAAGRGALLRAFDGWAAPFVDLIRRADGPLVPWPLYVLPAERDWRPVPGVTLLGDAAHVMPPFTGRGANMAMLDAVALAERLTSDRFVAVDDAIADHEAAMLARMGPEIARCLASQDMLIAPDAPDGLVASLGSVPEPGVTVGPSGAFAPAHPIERRR